MSDIIVYYEHLLKTQHRSEESNSPPPMDIDLKDNETKPIHPSLKDNFRDKPIFIESFPGNAAGAATSSTDGKDFGHYGESINAEEDNPYQPFAN